MAVSPMEGKKKKKIGEVPSPVKFGSWWFNSAIKGFVGYGKEKKKENKRFYLNSSDESLVVC